MRLAACLAATWFAALAAQAQEPRAINLGALQGDEPVMARSSTRVLPVISIQRQLDQRDATGLFTDDKTNVNLGVELTPIEGLSLKAQAWQIQILDAPAPQGKTLDQWQPGLPELFTQTGETRDFGRDQPFLGNNLQTNGIDVGASYVWETDKLGKFTLSTSATYINEFNQQPAAPAMVSLVNGNDPTQPGTPDLQGSITLNWQIGNHSARAVTNYFDSVKDISELNLEEINDLVENITTVDLQYGYNVTTGKQDRAVISFSLGIRNLFDKKTTQILNQQDSRVVDQNGRVAYGSIKYQF